MREGKKGEDVVEDKPPGLPALCNVCRLFVLSVMSVVCLSSLSRLSFVCPLLSVWTWTCASCHSLWQLQNYVSLSLVSCGVFVSLWLVGYCVFLSDWLVVVPSSLSFLVCSAGAAHHILSFLLSSLSSLLCYLIYMLHWAAVNPVRLRCVCACACVPGYMAAILNWLCVCLAWREREREGRGKETEETEERGRLKVI